MTKKTIYKGPKEGYYHNGPYGNKIYISTNAEQRATAQKPSKPVLTYLDPTICPADILALFLNEISPDELGNL